MVEETSAHGLRHVGYGVPTEMFPPFVSGAVSLSLGETFRTTRMACCWMQSFPDGFFPHEKHKNHHWTHVYMIHLNWWPWGKWLGRIFFSKNVPESLCIGISWSWWVQKGFFAFRLAVWRELELLFCFFFLRFSSVWKAQVYSESKKFDPSKTTNFHQTICKLQTIVFCMRLNSRAADFPVLKMSKDSASLIFHLGLGGFGSPPRFFFFGGGGKEIQIWGLPKMVVPNNHGFSH